VRVGRNVRVVGHVQGVFFRAWTQQQASELKISGWVRNASDGSVEGHLAGEDEAVSTLIARLHDGPPSAIVSNVTIEEAQPEAGDRFEVRH
jgi:acylphosphatase